jgi:hypothetical protein
MYRRLSKHVALAAEREENILKGVLGQNAADTELPTQLAICVKVKF